MAPAAQHLDILSIVGLNSSLNKSAMLLGAVWSSMGWARGITTKYLDTGDKLWLKEAVNSADPITSLTACGSIRFLLATSKTELLTLVGNSGIFLADH